MIQIDATDIIEHLITLRNLSMECHHITEMGIRNCVSTWPFLDGVMAHGTIVSIDLNAPPQANLEAVEKYAKQKEINFKFVQGDTTKIDIELTDLLFIDTNHTEQQLKIELDRHSDKARKYIVLHDTESAPELWAAIGMLLARGKWKIKQHYQNNNGLTILERIK